MDVGDVAGAVGRGLFAGVVGTAAMTVSSTVERSHRPRGSGGPRKSPSTSSITSSTPPRRTSPTSTWNADLVLESG